MIERTLNQRNPISPATRRSLLPGLISFTCAVLLLAPQNADASHPEEDRSRLLTVSATGKERLSATVADVRLAVEERGETHGEARRRMAERVSALLDYLRTQNVERLETASLQLHPIHDFTAGDRPIVGYQATAVVRFRADVPRVAAIIDNALASGANQVQELAFTAPEDDVEKARLTAARTASRLALQRADTVLDELGLQREEIHRIEVSTTDERPPVYPLRRMEIRTATQEAPPLDVEAGEHEITAIVTLEVRYSF